MPRTKYFTEPNLNWIGETLASQAESLTTMLPAHPNLLVRESWILKELYSFAEIKFSN